MHHYAPVPAKATRPLVSSVCRSNQEFGKAHVLGYRASHPGAVMRQAILAVFAAAFFAVSPLQAQTPPTLPPPPENLAAARELVSLMRSTDQFKALAPAIMQAIKPAIVQGRPEMDKGFDAVLPVVSDVMGRRASELADAIAVIYASNFSVAEINDIKAFYQSPTGQKYLAQQPMIVRESLVAGQKWAQSLAPELKEAIIAELRKRKQTN
jgi:uncharacterized protein